MDKMLEQIKKDHLDEHVSCEVEPKKGFFSRVFKKFWWLILLATGLLVVSTIKNNNGHNKILINETTDEDLIDETEDSTPDTKAVE